MCTVSWLHEDGGYQLFCNRDEKRSRAQSSGPHVETREGVRCIAPIDGNFGGSWIAVNEHGLSICLLNGKPSAGPFTSRGLLVLSLIAARSMEEVRARVAAAGLAAYAPFTMAALMPGSPAMVAQWNREELRTNLAGDEMLPLISSSFAPESVRERRTAEFAKMPGVIDAAAMSSFHASHADGPSAYSPCMHRLDAETVSFSRIRVTPREVEFHYSPGAPCRGLESEIKRMERQQ